MTGIDSGIGTYHGYDSDSGSDSKNKQNHNTTSAP